MLFLLQINQSTMVIIRKSLRYFNFLKFPVIFNLFKTFISYNLFKFYVVFLFQDKEREKKYEDKVEVKREISSPVAVKQEMRSPRPAARADTDDSFDDTSLIMDSFKQEPESSFNDSTRFKEEPEDESYQNQSSMLSVSKFESDGEDSDAPLVSILRTQQYGFTLSQLQLKTFPFKLSRLSGSPLTNVKLRVIVKKINPFWPELLLRR